MSAEGAEAVADIVKRAHLKELNLYMNDIGDAGILKVRSLGCPCAVLLLSLDAVANAVHRTLPPGCSHASVLVCCFAAPSASIQDAWNSSCEGLTTHLYNVTVELVLSGAFPCM